MLRVARIAHKYQAVELEKFAINQLSDSEALQVRQAYSASYDTQCRALLAFAGLGFVAALCLELASRRLKGGIEALGSR